MTNIVCPMSGMTMTWTSCATAEEVYGQHTDTAGNILWTGTQSGEHIFKAKGDEGKDEHTN